jgi:DedD protein
MDKALKQRLLGAAMLVSLMVIFLPLVLDGGDHRKTMETQIPVGREMPDLTVHDPQRLHLTATPVLSNTVSKIAESSQKTESLNDESTFDVADVTTAKTISVSKPAVIDKKENTDIGLDEARRVKAWVLQLASFKENRNANNLRDKLRKKGYKAYSEKRGGLTRVFVGPDLNKENVDRWKKTLNKELKLSGLVRRSYPSDD